MEILNLKALKDPVYRNICIGQSLVNFSDLNFFILQPMLLFQYGYDTVSHTSASIVDLHIPCFVCIFLIDIIVDQLHLLF